MKTNNTLIGAVALVSFFGLCGAKAQGCGGTVETAPAPAPCAQGYHLESVCQDDCYVSSSEDSSNGSGDCTQTCSDQCVPDDVCPQGTVEQTVCAQPLSGSGDSGCASDGTGCYEPPEPGECWTECVPEICPPDMIPQIVCEEPVYSSSDCLGADCEQPSPPPESCWTECVPIGPCGPGYHEETTCTVSSESGSGEEPPAPGECFTECVPDECPPDTIPVEVCTVTDPNGVPECWTECERYDEPLPEPPSAS
jgi:hypothetical protein